MTDGWETSSYGNQTNGYWNFTTYVAPNNSPTIINEDQVPTNTTVGSKLTHTIEATDPDPDTLTWSKINGPDWLKIGPDNGTIYGTPSSADLGSNEFEIQVNDGRGGTDSITFTITVESEEDSEGPKPDDDNLFNNIFFWLIIITIIVIMLILILLLRRRKKE